MYNINDRVEAYVQGAWRQGIIVHVLAAGFYTVGIDGMGNRKVFKRWIRKP